MITSTHNPLVKAIKKLHNSKGRKEQQLILLEGTNLLGEACAVNYPLVTVCCTSGWQESHPQLWEDAESQCERLELVTPEVLNAIATTVNPDGVVAIAKRPPIPSSPQLPSSLGLALETIQDPGNLGTIIRTAAAAGADGLCLSSDSVDVDNPKVLRASAGQWFRLPITVCSDLQELVCQCQNRGVQVVATLPNARLTYWEIDWRVPTLILLGNEAAGLRTELTELANVQVKIPLWRGVESLNVAIAASLMLYEAQRQRFFLPS
ncbi:MAG TPA: rRNA methyltransferase [Cyanobacteria bacterium UBA11149]|nr:rRNA methyltransferase [Cyanobacteria bacterium UBA11367]HBE60007.1 rRNA methyltransferase [Cyanobacteria bacterium UBA11366]HBK63844.1 rRNA methyltransferase [Cyanobacteria bacterium UBA11166]HBR73866.1 rRNA methyltransferase [Cyanobacteria bacterium UBA11159]HBS70083.1 rRNA methyltransferase [Cyanobacteria bacterium UBA11153]HBW89638.1 rRNA methyltransferase [Cyanobacteria bacterium UBA11149]HCA97389.1 rRNA methyltransferase [Cyanobacteria bacterium UBA9226]